MTTSSSTLRVGYAGDLYPERRNIRDRVPSAEYRLVRDGYVWLRRLARLPLVDRWLADSLRDSRFKFQEPGKAGVDLFHLFNQIRMGRSPWILTFETFVPRFLERLGALGWDPARYGRDPTLQDAVDLLAEPSCHRLLALSGAAARLQERFLEPFGDRARTILAKTEVLHPPQRPRPERAQARPPGSDPHRLHFGLVGHDFFRKGGWEVVEALTGLRDRTDRAIELTVVSRVDPDHYATGTTDEDADRARRLLREHRDWIHHHPNLPHEEVLEVMEEVDVGLLPSYGETYGYVVLEFQSVGRPVVTTDIRAFPEINTPETGWLVPLRGSDEEAFRDALQTTHRSRARVRLLAGLETVFTEILDDPGVLARKGEAALARIRRDHDPEAHARRLETLYREAAP